HVLYVRHHPLSEFPAKAPPPAHPCTRRSDRTVRPGVPCRPGLARHRPRQRNGPCREAGAAVVEFTLVTVVLVVLFLAILQLALALYVRNTLVAAAAEGAHYARNADRSGA